MDTTALFGDCPALRVALEGDASLRSSLTRLLEAGLAGVFVRYLSDARPEAVRAFLLDAAKIDTARVLRHRELMRSGAAETLRPDDVEPVPLVTLEEQAHLMREDADRGRQALSDGQWASVAFAGGAGTRFFSSLDELTEALPRPNEVLGAASFGAGEPKGVFPISPVAGLSFYEIIIADALEAGVTTGRLPRVLFLTSAVTHARTVQYLSGLDLWGFPRECWTAFQQAREPRLDADGNLIVGDEAGHLSWTGDGHGGVYRALLAVSNAPEGASSLLDHLQGQGVKHLVMHNVDNPAAHPFEPSRLGFHVRRDAQFTISAVRKTDPAEKVGLLMRIRHSGKVEVVEYNVLDEAVAHARDNQSSRLLHEAGNTNTNLVATDAVRQDIEPTLYTGKTVPSRIGPVAGSSMEMLNQHVTRLLDPDRVFAYEVARPDYFMPTKNITGVDSVASTTRFLSEISARRLRGAGARIADDALCDLHPACGDLAGFTARLEADARLYLSARHGDPAGAPVTEGPLTLEPRSSLVIHADRPYGEIRMDGSQRIETDLAGSSCVRLGPNLTIREGVRVVLRAGPGARLRVPGGRTFAEDTEIVLAPGEQKTV